MVGRWVRWLVAIWWAGGFGVIVCRFDERVSNGQSEFSLVETKLVIESFGEGTTCIILVVSITVP